MRNPPPPPPSRHHCPDCGAGLDGVRCPACGLVLVGDDAFVLWRIDQQLHQLGGERTLVLGRLRAQTHAAAAGAAPAQRAAPGDARTAGGPTTVPPPPPRWAGGPVAPWPGGPSAAGAGTSLPNLLLGLGTALVVVAAVVFAAVSWDRLGAAVQGLVLLGLTAAGAWGTRALHRRGLTATAEAIAVVTVALLPVDAEAGREAARALGVAPGPDGILLHWCIAIAVIAAASWWFGRVSGTRAPLVIAALAAQVPVPLFVLERPVAGTGGQVVLLAQVAATLVVVRHAGRAERVQRPDRAARAAALAGGAVLWCGTTAAATAAFDGDASDRAVGALVVALAAAVAGLAAALWADDDAVRPLAGGVATGAALGAAGLATSAVVHGDARWPVMAAVALAVVAVAVRVPRRWGDAPASVAGTTGAVLSLPLAVAVATALATALGAADPAWQHGAGTSTGVLAGGALDRAGLDAAPVVAHLAVAAGAALALRCRVGGRATGAGLAAVGVAGLALLPLLVEVPLAVAVAALIAGAGAASATLVLALAHRRGADPLPRAAAPVAVGALVPLAGLGLAWAAAGAVTTVAAVAAVGLLAAAVAAAAGRDGRPGVAPLAHAGAGVAVLAGATEAGLVAAALGAAPSSAWAAVALAAAAASGAGAGLDPAGTRRDLRGAVGRTIEATGATLHVVAALAVVGGDDHALTTVVLAVGAATLAVHALRPGRRGAAVGAVGEALVLVWLRLAWADVAVPEAYTLPVAVALLAAAAVAGRSGRAHGLPSWNVHGPWLVAAVAPTVLAALDDPGLTRPLGGLVVGVAVLAVGAVVRKRAAVDVGTVTVAVLGLRQLSPVVAELPNWVTLGTCGVVLLAVGATFEQRRRDLGVLRTRYAELG